MIVSYLSTLNWIKSLNLLLKNDWGPWFVDEQVAGLVVFSLELYIIIGGGSHFKWGAWPHFEVGPTTFTTIKPSKKI